MLSSCPRTWHGCSHNWPRSGYPVKVSASSRWRTCGRYVGRCCEFGGVWLASSLWDISCVQGARLSWQLWQRSLLSRAQAWAKIMEILGCPVVRIPLSALLARSNGKDEPIQLVSAQLQELPEAVTVFDKPPLGLHSRFSVRVVSLSLFQTNGSHKAVALVSLSGGP